MKIECVRIRQGGSKVELDGEEYHFKPTDKDPRHIAEVTKAAHIKTLLGIEAYRVADKDVADMIAPAKPVEPDPAPQGKGEGTDPDGNAPTGGTPQPTPAPAGTVDLDDLTDADLRKAYQLTLNKAPGGLKRPKLIEALKAAGYTPTAE